MQGILNGIRVLDMTRYIAGPYCGMLLADAGAEVIKVEKITGGDDTRNLAPWKNGVSLYFPAYNRNKKSVSVDFRSKEGIELLKKLVAESDVLVQNFRAGTMEKMGLSYDTLKEINPRLIMASISGYGQTGPYKDRPAFDNVIAAIASVCRVTEYGPFTGRGALNDYMAAMYATIGILMALMERNTTGRGQHVDVSMLSGSAMLRTINIAEVAAEVDPQYIDRDDCAPYGWARTKDGWIAYHAGTDSMFRRLLTICDEPVFHEGKYQDVTVRVSNEKLMKDTFEHWSMQYTSKEMEDLLNSVAIPVGIVNTPAMLLKDPHLNAVKHIVPVPVKGVGDVPYFGFPIRMSEHPEFEYRSAPELGEHNLEIFGDLLGVEKRLLDEYRERGILA